jgi:hypothetical protein
MEINRPALSAKVAQIKETMNLDGGCSRARRMSIEALMIGNTPA